MLLIQSEHVMVLSALFDLVCETLFHSALVLFSLDFMIASLFAQTNNLRLGNFWVK